jgi:hypothetical protein
MFILIKGEQSYVERGIKRMYSQIDKMGRKYHSLQKEIWLHHDLFSPGWWSIVIINVLFLILFIILIDRSRLLFISFVFAVNFILVGTVNDIGIYYHFWSYPHQLVVFTHQFFIVPVVMTLAYQFFSKWKSYLFAIIGISAIMCFIILPIFVHFNLYKLDNWEYTYSFIVIILMLIISKFFIDFVKKNAEKYTQ